MHVAQILARKGTSVATVAPSDTVTDAVQLLAEKRLGALVVSADGRSIDGILSERDIVRSLGTEGAGLLDVPVSQIMTAAVRTCAPADTVERLMSLMTEHRIRHLPVEVDGELAGIVSIGDVVKERVTELEDESRQITDYIQSAGYT